MKFTPEQFKGITASLYEQNTKDMADRAQALFDAWLEAQPVVTAQNVGNQGKDVFSPWLTREQMEAAGHFNRDTHRARLVAIEEIQKLPCEREHSVYDKPQFINERWEVLCRHCGVKLKAEWRKM